MYKVRILNASKHGAGYTTANQAQHYVRRGEAVLIGDVLHFLTHAEQIRQRQIEQQMVLERWHSDVYVDQQAKKEGAIWWNAGDIKGMHKPGELVS